MVSRRWPLALFTTGLCCPVIVFVASGLVAKPDWTGSSKLLDVLAIPILLIGAAMCFGAPFLLRGALSKRALLGMAALAVFSAVGVTTALICLACFGVPIR